MVIKKIELTVRKITPIEDNGKTVCKIFELSLDGEEFPFTAGQWANVGVPGYMHHDYPEKVYMSAFSICSSPEEKDKLEFLIGIREGHGLTSHMNENVKEGDTFVVQGPFGHFTLNEETKKQVWVATGTGIAPFISFLRTLNLKGMENKEVTLFYGCRNPNALYLGDEIISYKEKLPKFSLVEVLSDKDLGDEWKGKRGFVTPFVKEFLEQNNPAELEGYICGIPAMVQDIYQLFSDVGIPEDKIRREKYN